LGRFYKRSCRSRPSGDKEIIRPPAMIARDPL
jgi:hypothetical protein